MDLSREWDISSGTLRLHTADRVEQSCVQCVLLSIGGYLRGGCVTGILSYDKQ